MNKDKEKESTTRDTTYGHLPNQEVTPANRVQPQWEVQACSWLARSLFPYLITTTLKRRLWIKITLPELDWVAMARNTTQEKGKFETFRTRNQFEYGYPIGLPFCLELN